MSTGLLSAVMRHHNGEVAASILVSVYEAGTTSLATLYRSSAGTVVANPVMTDSAGMVDVYAAAGSYDLVGAGPSGVLARAVVVTAGYTRDEVDAGNPVHALLTMAGDKVIIPGAATPTDAVAGTGVDAAEVGAYYVKTVGKAVYRNTGTLTFPAWTLQAGQPAVSGAGAPSDGVTDGATNDLYSNTTAYALDPATGWYRCTDGTANTWAAVTGTILTGAGTPTDAVVGTGSAVAGPGSLYFADAGPYKSGGTKLRPTWTAV